METIRCITAADAAYPLRLAGLSQMPDRLYVLGALPDDDAPSVAIVGARRCTRYGHKIAEAFGEYLAAQGVQIISGMALGIDGYALTGALSAGGKAFAVLGSGVDVCYPRANQKLYDAMQTQGGIISEEAAGTPPLAYNFPKRNRIISALADIVIVVEARLKSGSMITVDHALDQGRTVFAVPGHVGEPLSDGCHYLIEQGASIARSPEAVYRQLLELEASTRVQHLRRMRREMKRSLQDAWTDINKKEEAAADRRKALLAGLSEEEAGVFSLLTETPRHTDVILQDALNKGLVLSVSSLTRILVRLKLQGVVEEVGKNLFVLRDL